MIIKILIFFFIQPHLLSLIHFNSIILKLLFHQPTSTIDNPFSHFCYLAKYCNTKKNLTASTPTSHNIYNIDIIFSSNLSIAPIYFFSKIEKGLSFKVHYGTFEVQKKNTRGILTVRFRCLYRTQRIPICMFVERKEYHFDANSG